MEDVVRQWKKVKHELVELRKSVKQKNKIIKYEVMLDNNMKEFRDY